MPFTLRYFDGSSDLASTTDAQSKETVVTTHHDAPRYILASAASGKAIRQAPVINHTDEELELIETLWLWAFND